MSEKIDLQGRASHFTTEMPNLEEYLLNDHSKAILKNTNMKKDHVLRSFHIAVLVKRGKIIETATNSIGSRSNGSGYSDLSLHAERAVVKKLGDISKLRGCTMYVWRIGFAEFYPMSSDPCSECIIFLNKCMKQYGLRNVLYTYTNTLSKETYHKPRGNRCSCGKRKCES